MRREFKFALAGALVSALWSLFVVFFPAGEGQAIRQGEFPSIVREQYALFSDPYKEYKVKEGKHLFWPLRSLWPSLGFTYSFSGKVTFDSAAYVFPREYAYNDGKTIDWDYLDWNKLDGMAGWLSRPNINAALIAWRWSLDSAYCFELTPYTNDATGDWRAGYDTKDQDGRRGMVTLCAGEEAYYSARHQNGEVLYTIATDKEQINIAHPWKRPLIIAGVNTWMGGEDNAPGPHGGVAPRDLTVKVRSSTQ